ncbi:MAG: GatB/YqeY domain-containing protein [Candidatus Paceibacterales bacterium]
MPLEQKIEENFKKAFKEKREIEVSTLRMLRAAIFNEEKEKRYKLSKEKPDLEAKDLEKESSLTDEEILNVIFSEIKKRKEALLLFEKGKREDLVKKTEAEIKILKRYLPKQLSEEEIKELAKKAIAALRASLAPSEREKVGIKDMGKVMAELMPKLKGKAEGSLVSKIVKELLS